VIDCPDRHSSAAAVNQTGAFLSAQVFPLLFLPFADYALSPQPSSTIDIAFRECFSPFSNSDIGGSFNVSPCSASTSTSADRCFWRGTVLKTHQASGSVVMW